MTENAPVLTMRGIEKHFGGVYALRGVAFDVRAGEVHALLGENGAGKSTLMNILSGVVAPDAGDMRLDGHPVDFRSPREAQAAGVVTIFQELDLVPGLSVAANLYLGREPMRGGPFLDDAAARRGAARLLADAGVPIDPSRRVAELGIGQRQLVAIAKALSHAARVLVMDEPTAALTTADVHRLFAIIRRLRDQGVGIVYISHRLEEVPHVADRVTILRDGAVVGQVPPDTPQRTLVQMLVGRTLHELFPAHGKGGGRVVLRLDGAGYDVRTPRPGWQAPVDISLVVRAGEIVGLAGIMGAGRTELLTALYGAAPTGAWRGTVEVDGKAVALRGIAAARRAGLALVTDDRRGSGLILRAAVRRNLVLSVLRRLSPRGFISRGRERAAVTDAMGGFDIRPPRPELPVGALSGGNQQKVVFAKELLRGPRLLLLDEPTRGVDVGAKAEIYARLRALTAHGLGVLMASSELPELTGLCDRVVVLRAGRSVAEFAGADREGDILALASGVDAAAA